MNNILIPPDGFTFQQAQRLLIDELNNALVAHRTLYAGNPAGWDPESAWGALQTITAQLSMDFARKLEYAPPLAIPTCQKYADRAAKLFIMYCVEHPLVRAGATTNHDAEKFAKVLASYLAFLVKSVRHDNPKKLFDQWYTGVRHV